ncbi:ParB/RepB/Spo0J family partition protein [Candidatus Omnitrophota bacterium]
MERKALGKGISALIPETEHEEKGARILFVKIDQLRASSFQPREDFDSEHLAELAQSIKEKGVIQPILVRRKGDHYEIIAGERRFRAASLLNLQELPVIIKDVDDRDSLELSLIENIQRQELNSIEEARAYKYLMEKFNLTQEKISEVLGKARVSVTNVLRLLRLPQEIQQEIKNNRLSFAHGRALLEVDDVKQQRRLAEMIIAKRLSVNELENLIKRLRPKTQKHSSSAAQRDIRLSVWEEELQRILATKVRIHKKKKRGYVLIEFFSQEDLERIVSQLSGA